MARFLSYRLSGDSPLYPGTPGMKVAPISAFDQGAPCNTYMISVHNHSGSHVDAPNHFNPKGRRIAEFGPDELIFRHPRMLDIPKGDSEPITPDDLRPWADRLGDADLLLIRTGFWRHRGDCSRYSHKNPWLHPDAASFLIESFEALRGVGVDCVSIGSSSFGREGTATHRILTGYPERENRFVLIFEDLDLSLDIESLNDCSAVMAMPWMVDGVDSTPCTVLSLP